MKYLRNYRVYESISDTQYRSEQDMRDICLELVDMGMSIHFDYNGDKNVLSRCMVIYNDNGSHVHDWATIKDYALRLKDYLGDDYLKFIYFSKDIINKNWHSIDLNEDTKISKKIISFGVEYKIK